MESDAASVNTLDDGTMVFRDTAGSIVYALDAVGNPISAASAAVSGIAQQFASLLNYGIRAKIDAAYAPAPVAQAAGVAGLPANLGSLILIAGAAFVAYKVISE